MHQLTVYPADHDGSSFLIFPSALNSSHLIHFCNLVGVNWLTALLTEFDFIESTENKHLSYTSSFLFPLLKILI